MQMLVNALKFLEMFWFGLVLLFIVINTLCKMKKAWKECYSMSFIDKFFSCFDVLLPYFFFPFLVLFLVRIGV